MADESFLLVSLKESKSKKLAQVISNETCRKILEALSKKEYTETDLAKKLGLPLSTVHYNIQQLIESRLVVVEEFHYSEKGKEVNHYKLAKKLIIIAPDDASESFMQKLKKILPAGLTTVITGIIIQLNYQKISFGSAAKAVGERAFDAAPAALAATSELQQASSQSATAYPGLWFVFGAIVLFSVYSLTVWIISKRKNN